MHEWTRTRERQPIRQRLWRIHVWALAIGLTGLGVSCQSDRSPAFSLTTPSEKLVWPQPPDPPRIAYVGAIRSPKDFGHRPGTKQWLRRMLVGTQTVALIKPVALARNESGLLVVADTGVPTVHFFDVDERKHWVPKRKYREVFRSPVGVAVTDDGTVYVADSVLRHVVVLSRKGEIIGRIGEGTLSRPTGIALSRDQSSIHVVDTLANQVMTFDREGYLLGSFGQRGDEPGQFNFPTHLSVTREGNLCVSDSLNFRIQIFRPDGELVTHFGHAGTGAGRFVRPKGVGVDTFGNIYAVDAAFENVQVFDATGRLLLAFGTAGKGPGEFTLPSGICVDSTNTIWVADSFNQRVLVFRLVEDTEV